MKAPGTGTREMAALALALGAVALGFLPLEPSAYLAIGRPIPSAGISP
jgi:hypothetical protein